MPTQLPSPQPMLLPSSGNAPTQPEAGTPLNVSLNASTSCTFLPTILSLAPTTSIAAAPSSSTSVVAALQHQQQPSGSSSIPGLPPGAVATTPILTSPNTAPSTPPFKIEESMNLYISQVPASFNSTKLREAFAKFGAIHSAKVMFDPITNESRCFGFVLFESSEDGSRAMAAMNGVVLEEGSGRLHVRVARVTALPQPLRGGDAPLFTKPPTTSAAVAHTSLPEWSSVSPPLGPMYQHQHIRIGSVEKPLLGSSISGMHPPPPPAPLLTLATAPPPPPPPPLNASFTATQNIVVLDPQYRGGGVGANRGVSLTSTSLESPLSLFSQEQQWAAVHHRQLLPPQAAPQHHMQPHNNQYLQQPQQQQLWYQQPPPSSHPSQQPQHGTPSHQFPHLWIPNGPPVLLPANSPTTPASSSMSQSSGTLYQSPSSGLPGAGSSVTQWASSLGTPSSLEPPSALPPPHLSKGPVSHVQLSTPTNSFVGVGPASSGLVRISSASHGMLTSSSSTTDAPSTTPLVQQQQYAHISPHVFSPNSSNVVAPTIDGFRPHPQHHQLHRQQPAAQPFSHFSQWATTPNAAPVSHVAPSGQQQQQPNQGASAATGQYW